DGRPVMPDVGHGQRHVFGEGAVAAQAKTDRVGTQVAAAGETVAAAAADDVALAADEVARVEVADLRANLDDVADELVAHDERRVDGLRRPRIPCLDVEGGATYARLVRS